jgi:hypothetical protein
MTRDSLFRRLFRQVFGAKRKMRWPCLGGAMAGQKDAATDRGYKTFFFLRQILKTTGQMPRAASRPALKGRRRAALTQTKASAKNQVRKNRMNQIFSTICRVATGPDML